MSRRIELRVELGDRSYGIFVGAGISASVPGGAGEFFTGRRVLLVSDANVAALHGEKVMAMVVELGGNPSLATVRPGEENKNLATMSSLYEAAVAAGLDRGSVVVGFGGGVPGDMAGFLAATYMRGVDFVQLPTSLLAMVDSSVGGKTGVDLPSGKNLVGAFWQPRAVIIDTDFLKTLPLRELRCGLAEIVKHAVIRDAEMFAELEANIERLLEPDLDFHTRVVARNCGIKAAVVAADEREGGLRAILNYGHSFGHAIEAIGGYGEFGHGEAVAIGMCMAADLAVELGLCEPDLVERQEALLLALGLPTGLPQGDPFKVLAAMNRDKKNRGGKRRLILPAAIGEVEISTADDGAVLGAIGGRCE